MSAFNLLDLMILGVLGISVLIGFALGFIRSVISVLVWVFAFLITIFMGPSFTSFFAGIVDSPSIQLWLAYGMVFIAAVAIGFILRMILRLALYTTMISGTDRLAGALFGLIRGILIIGIFLWFSFLVGVNQTSFYQASVLVKFFDPLISMMNQFFPGASEFVVTSKQAVAGFSGSVAPDAAGMGSDLSSSVPGMNTGSSSVPGLDSGSAGSAGSGSMLDSAMSGVKSLLSQIAAQVKSVF